MQFSPLKAEFILKTLAFFEFCVMSCSISIQTQRHRSAIKRSCRTRIPCHKREMLLKLNFFQLIERHRSWDSVLILIYWLDAHYLKNRNAHATKRWKKALHSSMNSLSWLGCWLQTTDQVWQTWKKKYKIQIFTALFGFNVRNAFQMSTNKPSIGSVVLEIVLVSLRKCLQNFLLFL